MSSAWGVAWGSAWGNSWGLLATSGGGTVPALPAEEDGGATNGAPSRRYYVDVDGEVIEVRSEAQARQVLLAEAQAEQARLEAQAEALRKSTATSVGVLDMVPAQFKTNADVPVANYQGMIDEAYEAAQLAASQALAEQARRKRQKELDDEAVIRLLM